MIDDFKTELGQLLEEKNIDFIIGPSYYSNLLFHLIVIILATKSAKKLSKTILKSKFNKLELDLDTKGRIYFAYDVVDTDKVEEINPTIYNGMTFNMYQSLFLKGNKLDSNEQVGIF